MKAPAAYLMAALFFAAVPPSLLAEPKPSVSGWEHRGFRCDMTALEQGELCDEVQRAVREQIDIVWSTGLPTRILDFMRGVPVKVVSRVDGSPARYADDQSIELSVSIVAYRHRPVLLHELLHAFHDQQLKDGIRIRIYEPITSGQSKRVYMPSRT